MSNTPELSFEFFPPKSEAMEAKLWDAIARLAPLTPDLESEIMPSRWMSFSLIRGSRARRIVVG